MRPFILQKEPTEFGRIRNLLHEKLRGHPEFEKYLEWLKMRFSAANATEPMRVVVPGDLVINSVDAMEFWLNAYQYHQDPEARAAFEAKHHPDLMPMELSVAFFLSILLEKAQAVIRLARVVPGAKGQMGATS
jgi:hypothetical protein